MEKLVLIVHVLTALAIIGLILIQQGKGADMGASFGSGSSQTVFGSGGGGSFFTRATAVLATLFFVTSFGLAIIAKQKVEVSTDLGLPEVVDPAIPMVDSDIPVVDVAESVSDAPAVETVVETVESAETAAEAIVSEAEEAVAEEQKAQ